MENHPDCALGSRDLLIVIRVVPLAVRRTLAQRMRRKSRLEMEKRAATITHVIKSIAAGIIATITVLTILKQFIDITAIIAGFGIVGIAVGFGAQYLVRDLIAGFFVFLENQYNVGDAIKLGDVDGIVEELSLRRTVLRDLNGARHMVPNGEIRVVSNLTQEWSRTNINIKVTYAEDIDRVMALMKKTWADMAADPSWSPFILAKEPSVLRVEKFEDSGIIICLVGETMPLKQWDIGSELLTRLKRTFDRENVLLPGVDGRLYQSLRGKQPG